MTFTAPALGAGNYEARAYYDWYGTNSYTVQQTSPSFTFAGGAALAATQASFSFGASVPINYSGFSGSTTDWIAIYVPGAPDGAYVAYQYTGTEGAGNSGQLVFAGLADLLGPQVAELSPLERRTAWVGPFEQEHVQMGFRRRPLEVRCTTLTAPVSARPTPWALARCA